MEQNIQLLESELFRIANWTFAGANSPKFPVRGFVQGLLGLAEGQVFLHLEHPCWQAA